MPFRKGVCCHSRSSVKLKPLTHIYLFPQTPTGPQPFQSCVAVLEAANQHIRHIRIHKVEKLQIYTAAKGGAKPSKEGHTFKAQLQGPFPSYKYAFPFSTGSTSLGC